jgi:hypothetical protein
VIGLRRSAPGRADDTVHDADPLAPRRGLRHHPPDEKRTRAGWLRRRDMDDALAKTITTLPQQLRQSVTWDRGKELSDHARLTVDTGMRVYFADPKSPWQGTAEGLISALTWVSTRTPETMSTRMHPQRQPVPGRSAQAARRRRESDHGLGPLVQHRPSPQHPGHGPAQRIRAELLCSNRRLIARRGNQQEDGLKPGTVHF